MSRVDGPDPDEFGTLERAGGHSVLRFELEPDGSG
jgi:hypothetical protein